MAAAAHFRSAINGFNRTDVVRYIETINTKHSTEVNQLKSELAALREELELARNAARKAEEPGELDVFKNLCQTLQQERDNLNAQLEQAQKNPPVEEKPVDCSAELEAYRRAERMERIARERATQIYEQANGALAEASVQVEEASQKLGGMVEEISSRITALQAAVAESKQALQAASSALVAIRPEDE